MKKSLAIFHTLGILGAMLIFDTVQAQYYGNIYTSSAPDNRATTRRANNPSSDNYASGIGCFSRGNFSLGTRIGFSTGQSEITSIGSDVSSTGGNTSLQMNITPSLGYFFADNFTMGLGMDYLLMKSNDTSPAEGGTDETRDSRLLFGPYIRLYIPIADDQAFFLGGVAGFGRSDTEIEVNGENQSVVNNIQTYGIGPGYTIIANNCLALETQVKYNFGASRSTIDVGGVNSETVTKANSVDFVVGLTYYFSR